MLFCTSEPHRFEILCNFYAPRRSAPRSAGREIFNSASLLRVRMSFLRGVIKAQEQFESHLARELAAFISDDG